MYFKGIKEMYIELAPDFVAMIDFDGENNKELYLQQLQEYIKSKKERIYEKRRYKSFQSFINKANY